MFSLRRTGVKVVLVLSLALGSLTVSSRPASALPPFARQTGQRCSACHVGGNFPQLTSWGRWFKLTGYTAGRDFWSKEDILDHVPVGTFGQAGVTWASEPKNSQGQTIVPDSGNVAFNQITIAAGTRFSDFMGLFYEYGYSNNFPGSSWAPGGVDLRAAHIIHPFDQELLLGISMNNQPGVQDVWNTVPLWTFPFYGSPVAPGAPSSTVIENLENQTVGGTGVYAMLNRGWYAEVNVYANPNGFYQWLAPGVNDSTLCLDGPAPYWRGFWTRDWGPHTLMVGTYGIHADVHATGCNGPSNGYTDAAFDSQYDYTRENHQLSFRTSYTHEWQSLDASWAQKASSSKSGSLDSFNINGTYTLDDTWAFSAAYLLDNGSSNADLYGVKNASGAYVTTSPNTSGYVLEVNYLFTQNLKAYLQYAGFFEFNGRGTNIDGYGRSASDNNSLWLSILWAF